MSGRVNVRYCNAPARERYRVGSSNLSPELALNLDLVSTGVFAGLQLVILARAMMSEAYLD